MSDSRSGGAECPDWRAIVRRHLHAPLRERWFGARAARLEDVVEELAQHLEDEYRDAVRSGLSPEQARRRVLAGEADWRDLARAISGPGTPSPRNPLGTFIENLGYDLRFALRTLSAQPVFTASVVLLLALGIGANTALFTVVHSVLFAPLPYADPSRLAIITEAQVLESGEFDESNLMAANLRELRERSTAFEGISAWVQGPATLTGAGEPELLAAIRTTNNFFAVLGINAAVGSTFPTASEEAARTAVLDHGFWSRRFAADRGIVGSKLVLNSESYTVVGVAPEGFRFVERADVYVVGPRGVPEPPLDLGDDYENDRSTGYMTGFGRLRSGTSFELAGADMERIGQDLAREYPKDRANRTFMTIPLRESMVGSVASELLLLLGAVGFVLLIACANVANLLLARAGGRRREVAVRTALGASRGRVVRQLITESVALSAAGGIAGIGLALVCLDTLQAVIPGTLPRAAEIGIDGTVLAFTAGLSLLTGVLFGAAPALQTAATDLQTVLRDDTRGASGGRARARVRDGLVVVELALTVVLLIGAGLTLRSFVRLQSQSPGFEADGVMTVRIALPAAKYDSDDKIIAFYRELVDEVRALPGVESAATVLGLPFSGTQAGLGYRLWGQSDENPGFGANFQAVSPGYFEAMGIPLLAGRDFTPADSADVNAVVIVNEVLAKRHFAGVETIGQALKLDDGPDADPVPIVGVVGSTRHFGYDSEPGPEVYLSFEQLTFPFTSLVVRATGDPEDLTALLRSTVMGIDPGQPLYRAQMLEDLMADTVAQPRFNVQIITVFAAVALLLSAVGVFGVISYTVSQRTRELGIRMALGAARGQVMGMVFRQAAGLVAAGIGLGLAGAFGATRLAQSLWFGVSATDPLVFLAVPAILSVTALLATFLPALRATRVDPVVALRSD